MHQVDAGAPVEAILVLDDWLFAATQPVAPKQGLVRVWHMTNGFEQTLEGHQGAVWCLAQGGKFLFSAGDDAGIKTWQYGESGCFEPVVNLAGHQAPIQDMKVASGTLLSGDRSGTVLMWNLDTGVQTGSIATGHKGMLMSLWVEDTYLFTAALDGHVKVWDGAGSLVYDHTVTNQHNQPSGITSMLVVNDSTSGSGEEANSVLITACDDKALKMWKLPSFDKRGIIASRSGHSDVVRCLAKGPGNSFFSGGMDRNTLVWEFMGK